jgi:hypothetical protein
VVRPGGRFAGLALGAALAGYFWYRYQPELFVLLRRDREQLWDDLGRLGASSFRLLIVATVILAILSVVVRRLLFRWENRLTKDEWSTLEGQE